ncbi:hypothetical protein SDRG_11292 [Saprolegnia diclina VS20]|uniref:WRKY19-like zinc finger domain-containing protein n=1 Tax=Saprolegnia diclina (strain VS20) TaxID=1156394 RepID=T0RMA4_SAPDV|nr:hypothetical protein SDRG_11292 [Saprolegnia diclina VS20]EQC31107.1 hypothetical protein SDRG_11292 [Saprolegnia diclina VS20]|eukprot:XP_008615546.1 hypothetical protein SDRG_11292 [Saprolegnia diclina VS20]
MMAPCHCNYEHCDRFAKQSGLCLTHFRWVHPTPPAAVSSPTTSATMTSSPRFGADPKLKLKNRNRKCRTEHCLSYARSGGFCTRHGGGRKCRFENCSTASQTGGYCRLHGGGSRCRVANCAQFARIGGLCLQHNRGREAIKPDDAPMLFPVHA